MMEILVYVVQGVAGLILVGIGIAAMYIMFKDFIE